jgi:tetratricopeptide (TPR) repeat protein
VTVGGWTIDPASGDATREGRTARLQPRPLEVLLYLHENRGRVVSKEELLETVWEGRFVTQDVVWRAVCALRRALAGPGGSRPGLVETIPGRGYRLAPEEPPPSGGASPRSPRGRGRWRSLLVRRATPAALGLAAVLAGWLWLRADTRPPEAPTTPPAGAGEATDAREHYRRGIAFYKRLDEVDVERSIAAFRRALELDPHLVEARAALASSYCIRGLYRYDQADLDTALATARQAVAEAPDLAAGHKAMALSYRALGRNRQALESSRRAVELDPDYPEAAHNLGASLCHLGRPHLAVEWHRRAVALDRRQVVFAKGLADAYYLLGDWTRARRWYGEALEREPFHAPTTAILAKIDLLEGRVAAARELLAATLELHPESPELLLGAALVEHVRGDREATAEYLERASRATGGQDVETYLRQLSLLPPDESGPALDRFVEIGRASIERDDEDWWPRIVAAGGEAVAGHRDEALDLLSQAVELGFLDYRLLRVDPLYRELWGDPRFGAFTDRLARRVQRLREEVRREVGEPPPDLRVG